MKKTHFTTLLLAALMVVTTACAKKTSIEGKWYGLYSRSLLTITFNAKDKSLDFVTESSASMSFNSHYTLNTATNPIQVDITGATGGMAAAGIARLNADKSLDFCLTFGAPGMVQRPTTFEPDPQDMTTMAFHLERDKAKILSQISRPVNAPASASLAFERNKRLGQGINLNAVVDGNLHPGYQRDAPLPDSEIKSIADAGFQSIRLDVCWRKHALSEAPYTIDPKFFEKVDHIINECFKNGMAVSIDQHYYPYINCAEPDSVLSWDDNLTRLDYLWQQIAEHYKNYSNDMLFFDIMNEPDLQLGAEGWNKLFAKLIKTIRKTNPDRTLIIMTPNLGQSWTLNYLDLPQDDWNLIVQCHYYMPHLFTHQGLAYAQAQGAHNVSWDGTADEKSMIDKDMDFCQHWGEVNHRPVNIGEYGCINTADQASRVRYIGYVLDAIRKRGMSSHLWGYREPFMIRDEKTGEWIQEILKAMNLKGTTARVDMNSFVDDLLSKMTIDEKIGQLNLTICSEFVSGQINDNSNAVNENLKQGKLGGLFGFKDAARVRELQKTAVEGSRLHIPLIFGYDVIHGFDVTFPIPLALSTSWNPSLVEEMARISAKEAAADGVCWTYSPMVDICHDARWGRIAEGSGEDPFLGSRLAEAYVRGYQGNGDLSGNENIMACVKHYALYGAADGGRDYNTVDMSRQRAFNEYMAPYKAAADAGAGSFMASFNEFEGIPAHCNEYLLDDVLRKQWGFKGFVTTDYTGIMETTQHGIGDEHTATVRAMKAGIDMDMMSEYYIKYLKEAIEKGEVSEEELNTACRRILEAKFKLGLFLDPYKYCDPKRSAKILGCEEHVKAARDIADKCQVLLKNQGNILPLAKNKNIAVVGPLANNSWDMLGSWSGSSKKVQAVSLYDGICQAVDKASTGSATKPKVTWAEGSWLVEDSLLEHKICNQFVGALGEGHKMAVHTRSEADLLNEALAATKDADVIVAALGENLNMNGEGTSRANPSIPEPQQRLLKALLATGKPVVLVVFTGRPLILTWENDNVPAILNSWFLGVQAGPAIADVLFGDVNPSGRLTTSFPRAVGQLPMSYNHKNTGRPCEPEDAHYIRFRSDYQDVLNTPLYPFGYGLSYTTFDYSDVKLSATQLKGTDKLQASVTVRNTGSREGTETVQMYLHDEYSTSTRPVKELKGFQQITLVPGESRTVTFDIDAELLKYYNHELQYVVEPGNFDIMIGPNSRDLKTARFNYAN